MSMLLMVKAMQLKVGNPLRKLVLIKLADNANDLGECWPSYQHIADQCEISRSSVKNHIRELEKSGIVTRVFRRNGELNQSNIFRLNLDNPSGAGVDPVGQELTEGGAGDARGGGAGADPRTSHSFESVKEPERDAREKTGLTLTSESIFDDRGRTAIDLDWQPNQKTLHAMCTKSGVDQGEITSDMITAFKLWYSGKQTYATSHGWHTNLVRWAIRERSMDAKSQAKQSQQPNFHDDDGSWASDLGW